MRPAELRAAGFGRFEPSPQPLRASITLCLKLALPTHYVPTDMLTGSRLM